MTDPDTRWRQRLDNYRKALAQLEEAVALMGERELSRLEEQGVIQAFEYCYELGLNVMRDYLLWQGFNPQDLGGPRDTIREAFAANVITDGEAWMDMMQDRNRTSHTYNEATAQAILTSIRQKYYGLFQTLKETMELL